MTPTLARMVAARQGQLHFPIKWFAVAQCFRYERMTRGRKREHYQWNLDIIGETAVTAEAEVLAAAADALAAMGLPDSAYRIRVNNRALLAEILASLGIADDQHAAVFLALDKRGKLPDDEIAQLLRDAGLDQNAAAKAFEIMGITTLRQAAAIVGPDSAALRDLEELFALAALYGIADRLVFDIGVIRGLIPKCGTCVFGWKQDGVQQANRQWCGNKEHLLITASLIRPLDFLKLSLPVEGPD